MSTPGPGPQHGPPPGSQPPGYGYPPPSAPSGRAGVLVLGLVAGLVLGAGALGLAWALSGPGGGSGGDPHADAVAVCGIVERTKTPDLDTPLEDLRRWGVSELGPSMAKQDPDLKPLADALERTYNAIRRLDTKEIDASVDKVRQLCADL